VIGFRKVDIAMSESSLETPVEGLADTMVTLSESAAKRINVIVQSEAEAGEGMVRVEVSGGGCAGFQYGFSFDSGKKPDDTIVEREGAKVVIDAMSLEFLKGSEIDFVEDLIGSAFSIKNPNATSACSCGSSFAV